MTCSELNFVQSQHFYGLAIATKDSLPRIDASDEDWLKYLDRLNYLAHISATRQIKNNKEPECLV